MAPDVATAASLPRRRGIAASRGRPHGRDGAKGKGPMLAHRALEIGAGEESRTPDLRITNALLYQLSYTGLPA